MLKMMFTKRAVQEIAPWATMVTPELVLNKDGSLLTVFEFEGIDADSPNPGDITAARDNLDHACRNFDHRVTAWWRMSHRRVKGGIDGDVLPRRRTRASTRSIRRTSAAASISSNSHSLALAFTPETGISRVFDKISYHMTVGGKNLFVAMFEAAKDTILARSAFAFDLTKIQNEIKRFESVIDGFVGGVTRLKMNRLQLQNILSFLHQRANPSSAQAPGALSGHDAGHASDRDGSHDRGDRTDVRIGARQGVRAHHRRKRMDGLSGGGARRARRRWTPNWTSA